MASSLHNLSDYDPKSVPSAEGMRFAVVVSEWNSKITHSLMRGAVDTLLAHGAREEDIQVRMVPGSFELVFGSAQVVKAGVADAVIAIGCLIKGDTPHFDYICQGATQGLAELNVRQDVPVIYGLLTCNNMDQAEDRCGGILGNKGDECAVTAIKMVPYRRQLLPDSEKR